MPYPEQLEEMVKERKSIIALHSGAESVDEWLRSALTRAFQLGIEASGSAIFDGTYHGKDNDGFPNYPPEWIRDRLAQLKGKEPKL